MHFSGPGAYHALAWAAEHTDLPCAYIVGELKAVWDVKRLRPDCLVGYRSGRITEGIILPESFDACYQAGRDRFDQIWPEYAGIPADVLSFFNEWLSFDDVNQFAKGCEVYRGLLSRANESGVKVTVLDLFPGHPKVEDRYIVQAMQRVLTEAQSGGHWLNVHWYYKTKPGTDTFNEGLRWTRFGDFPRLNVLVGEYGPMSGVMPRGADFLHMLAEADRIYAPYRDRAKIAIFTLIGQPENKWKLFNFEQDLALYQAHLVGAKVRQR